MVPFALVGFVVARRQPRNPIGWTLLGVAGFFVLSADAGLYLILDYRVHHGGLPFGPVAVLLQPGWAPAIVLRRAGTPLPDGRLPASRWRWGVWGYLAVGAFWWAGALVVATGAILGHTVHVTANGDLTVLNHPTGSAAWWGTVQNVFFRLGLKWAGLVVRSGSCATGGRRRSAPLQLKWLISGASAAGASALITIAFSGSSNAFLRLLVSDFTARHRAADLHGRC